MKIENMLQRCSCISFLFKLPWNIIYIYIYIYYIVYIIYIIYKYTNIIYIYIYIYIYIQYYINIVQDTTGKATSNH